MKLKFSTFTHRGYVRKTNQDNFFVPDEKCSPLTLFMVADGMGGHNAGDVASKIAVESIVDYFTQNSAFDSFCVRKSVFESIKYANSAIISFSKTHDRFTDMGTTLTFACVQDNKAFIGHIGDSRAYIIKNGNAKQITRDHSLVQELYEKGTITKAQMNSHPNRNILTRALGLEASIEADCYEIALQEGDLLLLCTDGLNLYIDIEQNMEMFNSGFSTEEIVNALGQKALDAGGADNITIIAAKCLNSAE
jgi:protein phosphatase